MAAELGIEHLTGATLIGQGGSSAVYAATDERFDRRVAVKLFFRFSAQRDRERFERECRIMGRLSAHPNVVTVHDAGHTAEGRPYIIMELVAGGSLADRLAESRRIPWPTAVDHLVPITRALGHGHDQGILHRDVKPENILLDGDHPKLTDFGIASVHGVTSSTMVSASWNHSPPETFRNRRDARSDLYSLGSTLYTLIKGSAPFADPADDSLGPMVHRLLYDPPPRLPAALAPPELADLLLRALAKDPALRPQAAEELAQALEAIRVTAPAVFEPVPYDDEEPAPVTGAGSTLDGYQGFDPFASDPTPGPTDDAGPVFPPPAHRQRPRPGVTGRVPSAGLPDPGPGPRSAARRAALVAVPVLVLGLAGAAFAYLRADGGGDDTTTETTADAGGSPASADDGSAPARASITEPVSPAATLGPQQWSAGAVDVVVVAGLADGQVAVGGKDGLIRLFDPSDLGREPVVLNGFDDWVSELTPLSDGRLAAGSDDSTVRIWDPARPDDPPLVFDDGISAEIHGLVELPDGRLAFGRMDGRVQIWDPARPGGAPTEFVKHAAGVLSLALLPDGRLASGGKDDLVRVWDPSDRQVPEVVLPGHTASVSALAVLPDGRVASGSDDGTIRVWDLTRPEAEPLVLSYGETQDIRRVIALPDGRLAAVENEDAVSLWLPDAERPVRFRLVDDVVGESEYALALLPDGRMVSGASSGQIRIRPVPLG